MLVFCGHNPGHLHRACLPACRDVRIEQAFISGQKIGALAKAKADFDKNFQLVRDLANKVVAHSKDALKSLQPLLQQIKGGNKVGVMEALRSWYEATVDAIEADKTAMDLCKAVWDNTVNVVGVVGSKIGGACQMRP